MSRYIDADALKERFDFIANVNEDEPYGFVDDAYWELENAPTVDAVPVVRCKDCKHLLVINGNELYATCRKSVMQFDSFGVDTREFYCAYGERKDGEHD